MSEGQNLDLILSTLKLILPILKRIEEKLESGNPQRAPEDRNRAGWEDPLEFPPEIPPA